MNELEKYYKSVFQEILERFDSDIRYGLSLMSAEDLEALKISRLDIEQLRIDSIVGNLCYVHEYIQNVSREIKKRTVFSDDRMRSYNRQSKALSNAEKVPAIYRAMGAFMCRKEILGSDVSDEEKWKYISYVRDNIESKDMSCNRASLEKRLVKEK